MLILKIFKVCVFLSVNFTVQCQAARILAVFPVPSISHQVVFRPLIRGLVERGHEVVVITPDPAYLDGQAPTNLTEIDVHDISYKVWTENIVSASHKPRNAIDQLRNMFEAVTEFIDKQFQDEKVLKLLRDKSNQFDLLLIEACARPALIYSHFYKVPTILISSLTGTNFNYENMGVSTHPTLYPSVLRQRLFNLTLWEKLTELYNHYSMEHVIAENEEKENAMLRKRFGTALPKLSELNKNVHMLLLNGHPIFDGIRAVPPSVVYIGGIHQKPEKPLPEDLKTYLDSASKGVIYVSFGTNVDPTKISPEKIQVLVKVLSQTPYDVLWKWKDDELPGRSRNIKLFKWLPQSDLLRHPNIKLFITQGGLQSTDEAITAGVPLIGIPMLGDQWYNVEQYVRLKIGIKLDIETFDEIKVTEAIQTVIGDESYRRNIIKVRTLIYDQPQKPLERAIWWVEHVLRHEGAEHLKSPAANISWWDYLELELVLFLVGTSLVGIVLISLIAYLFFKFVARSFMTKSKNKRS